MKDKIGEIEQFIEPCFFGLLKKVKYEVNFDVGKNCSRAWITDSLDNARVLSLVAQIAKKLKVKPVR